tara:strand:- start:417 stop:527 length:111 start_codon:yes stop_codon:yes gene_type:complete
MDDFDCAARHLVQRARLRRALWRWHTLVHVGRVAWP